MVWTERNGCIFEEENIYYIAHCISSDFVLRSSISRELDKRKKLKDTLNLYPLNHKKPSYVGSALLINRVFNLITEEKYYEKPTYKNLRAAFCNMKLYCIDLSIKRVAICKSGSGFEPLDWKDIRYIITDIFKDMDIEFVMFP